MRLPSISAVRIADATAPRGMRGGSMHDQARRAGKSCRSQSHWSSSRPAGFT